MDRTLLFAGIVFAILPCGGLQAVDHLSVRRGNDVLQVSGHVIIESQDGGVLLEDRAGVLWAVPAAELAGREQDDEPFAPFDAAAMTQHLLQEFPAGFRTHTTAHYVIGYNTSQEYARWCGALFERLYLAFSTFWKQRGLPLKDPAGPLVALVFDTKQSYSQYAQKELGDATPAVVGYFSLRTNRVTMYDLTGLDAWQGDVRTSSAERINRILARPEAERTVATIIHEATHQLAFNCGLQVRYADIPLWVSEGIAVYFETPDLQSRRGWRNIGGINQVRWGDFQRYLPRRPPDSLSTLLSSDERFRQTTTAADAYAEAWSLNYYLIRKRLPEYVAYLKTLSEKRPLLYDEPQERLRQFEQSFGGDLAQLDAEFVKYLRTAR